jgi:hypothetical protein
MTLEELRSKMWGEINVFSERLGELIRDMDSIDMFFINFLKEKQFEDDHIYLPKEVESICNELRAVDEAGSIMLEISEDTKNLKHKVDLLYKNPRFLTEYKKRK